MNHRPFVVLPLLSLLSFAPLVAQGDVVERAPGNVTTRDGVPRADGEDYVAQFFADGVAFAARGDEHTALRLQFDEVRRGAATLFRRERDCTPEASDRQVRYRHTADLTEAYDVYQRGIEQSFVFASRPEGAGDLVVRCAITTDLPLLHANDDGVRFGRTSARGVSVGAVTGIDRNGARCRGAIRCDGAQLELSLPASFVDSAAYPLVLDPWISSEFLIANIAGGSDVQPSIAYSEFAQRYLVVWSVPMSATTAEIHARFMTSTGFLGPQTLLTTTATPGVRPAVAYVRWYDRFVVSWASGGAALVVQITAVSGGQTNPVPLNFSPGLVTGVALGGDRRSVGSNLDEALVVVTTRHPTTAAGSAYSLRFSTHPSLGGPGAATTIYSNATLDLGPPAVCKHVGTHGSWLYTIPFRDQQVPSIAGLIGRSVRSSNGVTCGQVSAAWSVAGGPFALHSSVAAVGNGLFLVAYQTGSSTIALRRVSVGSPFACSGSSVTWDPPFDPTGSTGSDDRPEVDYANGRYLLVWRHASPTTPNVKAMSIGSSSGAGAEYLVQGPTASTQYDPAVATRESGGDVGSDEAMIVWASAGIRARRWEATGSGTVTNLGGACGIPGFSDLAVHNGTPIIGASFSLEVVGPTAPVLGLVVGFTANPLVCGPCTLVPNPDVLIGGAGPVSITVPLNAGLIGAELIGQWLQWRQAGCPLASDYGLTNALKFTIAE